MSAHLLALLVACAGSKPGGEPTGTIGDTGDSTATVVDDVDGDGFAATPEGDDCDDADASVHPGADEVCGDGVDQDCDGLELGCTGVLNSTQGGGWLEGGGQTYGLGKGLAALNGWSEDGAVTIAITAPWWEVEPYDIGCGSSHVTSITQPAEG